MSDLASWQEGNEKYLSAALAWLRQRLERLAERKVVLPSTPSQPASSSWLHSLIRKLHNFIRKPSPVPSSDKTMPPSGTADENGSQAAVDMAAAEAMEPPPALVILSQRLGLSRFEQELLFLCAAMEIDPDIADLCAKTQGGQYRPYPTFALALVLFDEPRWDVLSPERPLRYWHLLEINQSGSQSLTISPLRADERIVSFIKGLNYLDDRLSPLLIPFSPVGVDAKLPHSQQASVDAIVKRLKFSGSHELGIVQLLGPDTDSKQMVAGHVAAALDLNIYRMPAELLPAQAGELETLARLWERESILMPISLYLDAHDADSTVIGLVNRFLALINGIVFLDTRDIWPGLNRSAVFEITKQRPSEQATIWAEALGQRAGESPALLSGQFNLNCVAIQEIAESELREKEGAIQLHDRLWSACLASTRPRLDVLAQRLDPKATKDNIILPQAERKLLEQIVAQVKNRSKVYDDGGFRRSMNRGLGIGVLFAGESGTGKTMAAEVIANELQLNLYRIDLSQVVSKYIGETEKNLRRLFDAAEDGGAILFFDEADSLFGKRSEVKDSHDRYANIEVSYLLQRMESFGGLAILATNMKSALDQAFLRRLRFAVDFPHPGPEDRKKIWQKVFPEKTKKDGLDYGRLARLNLTGGGIHNAALNAAFLAANAGTPVTMQFVLDAARTEFRKQDKPIIEADFRL